MHDPDAELQFYRRLCNELGARVLRLQNAQTQAKREARRAWLTAVIMHDVYRLISKEPSIEQITDRFLRIILDRLHVDRAMLLNYDAEKGALIVSSQLGLVETELVHRMPWAPSLFVYVNSRTPMDPEREALCRAAHAPYVLWVYNTRIHTGLLLANEIEDRQFHLPFDIHDQELVESALNVLADIIERINAETERRRLEARIQQAQRLENLGILAGSISHDFNNLLATMLGFAESAMRDTPSSSPAHSRLERLIETGTNAKELIKQILVFSQHGDLEREPVSLEQIVQDVAKLAGGVHPGNIVVKTAIKQSGCTVLANRMHMQQLLMNLCRNAIHAMQQDCGTLTIELEPVKLSEGTRSKSLALAPGSYIKLSVTDTGIGMDESTQHHIFEPFFSTKTTQRGAGMGLAIVQGIVSNHGGAVTVASQPGRGSTFEVYLPRIELPEPMQTKSPDEVPRGTEHILLVEDEPDLAEMTELALSGLGYTVSPENDALEAIRRVRETPDRYDLVITDHMMPQLTGEMLASELQRLRPGLPIILLTGYAAKVTIKKTQAAGIAETIMKPVLINQLAQTIRRILDRPVSL